MPTWARAATANQLNAWDTRKALVHLDAEQIAQIPALWRATKAACEPATAEVRKQRLTALGMSMAPNRKPAEATMWLHEFTRLLGDLPADLLNEAIDACQRAQTFLPSVAEIRALADPKMEDRRRILSRLDAMRRYVESGQPMPKLLPPPPRPVLERRGEAMSETETAELNRILEYLGACTRYRPDGSRYEVSERKVTRIDRPPPSMPTRQDYIDMGVDPAVLDRIEAEKSAQTIAKSL